MGNSTRRVLGWHNFDSDLRLMQSQLKQLMAQADALSKAISEVTSTGEVEDGNSKLDSGE